MYHSHSQIFKRLDANVNKKMLEEFFYKQQMFLATKGDSTELSILNSLYYQYINEKQNTVSIPEFLQRYTDCKKQYEQKNKEQSLEDFLYSLQSSSSLNTQPATAGQQPTIQPMGALPLDIAATFAQKQLENELDLNALIAQKLSKADEAKFDEELIAFEEEFAAQTSLPKSTAATQQNSFQTEPLPPGVIKIAPKDKNLNHQLAYEKPYLLQNTTIPRQFFIPAGMELAKLDSFYVNLMRSDPILCKNIDATKVINSVVMKNLPIAAQRNVNHLPVELQKVIVGEMPENLRGNRSTLDKMVDVLIESVEVELPVALEYKIGEKIADLQPPIIREIIREEYQDYINRGKVTKNIKIESIMADAGTALEDYGADIEKHLRDKNCKINTRGEWYNIRSKQKLITAVFLKNEQQILKDNMLYSLTKEQQKEIRRFHKEKIKMCITYYKDQQSSYDVVFDKMKRKQSSNDTTRQETAGVSKRTRKDNHINPNPTTTTSTSVTQTSAASQPIQPAPVYTPLFTPATPGLTKEQIELLQQQIAGNDSVIETPNDDPVSLWTNLTL